MQFLDSNRLKNSIFLIIQIAYYVNSLIFDAPCYGRDQHNSKSEPYIKKLKKLFSRCFEKKEKYNYFKKVQFFMLCQTNQTDIMIEK
ncbi:unnamed protein product [Paramecium pentaurelia]|uniref:Uncharacterized protein n=1 Tax=Paramecium pentaurelia TaxID=43138 RepID=A0A8S1X8J2_9CILI|nr:unnamed protein product [Paramecium pentaurelia]